MLLEEPRGREECEGERSGGEHQIPEILVHVLCVQVLYFSWC
jgi:hypothetical protein